MPLRTVEVPFPSEVLDSLAATYQDNADVIKEAAVLELYREGRISAGKAAEILDMAVADTSPLILLLPV